MVAPMSGRIRGRLISRFVFSQWRKAAQLACSGYLWIAGAETTFRSRGSSQRIVAGIVGNPVALGFADGQTVNIGAQAAVSQLQAYCGQAVAGALARPELILAEDFVRRFLAAGSAIQTVGAGVW